MPNQSFCSAFHRPCRDEWICRHGCWRKLLRPTNNLMEARLAAATVGGIGMVCIFPKLERRVGLFDTKAIPYLVDSGRRATEALLPSIMAMIDRTQRLAAA